MTLHDYVGVLSRRKWLVILFVVLVPATALLLDLGKEDVFSASADVLITNQNAAALVGLPDPGLSQQSAERLAQTQASIARTPELARQTLRAAGVTGLTASDFLKNSSVSAQPNEDLLRFVVKYGSAKQAVLLATEYARQFPVYRRSLDVAALARTQAEVQQRLDRLERQGQRGSALYKTLDGTRQQLSALGALQTTSAQLVRPADEATQIAPRPARALVLGLILGLLAGVAFAFARDAMDSRVRSPEEIASALKLPLLGRLPAPPKGLRHNEGIVSLTAPASGGSEAFRILRTNIEFASVSFDTGTILVTSASPSEGKSTTAANLGVSLALSGKSVVVVDCDLRRPAIGEIFDLPTSRGLTDVALGRYRIEEVVRTVIAHGVSGSSPARQQGDSVGSLDVLLPGPLPPNPGEFVASHAVAEILSKLRGLYDIVLIDTPPMLEVGDAMSLSRHADAVMLVVRLSMARKQTITESRRILDSCPANELGVVVTDTRAEGNAYLGYGEYAMRKSEQKLASGAAG